jgi:hypothetical protein
MGHSPQAHCGHRAPPRVSWLDAKLDAHPRLRRVLLVLYYIAVIAGLIVLYGRGDFSTPPFVYQGF